MLKSFLSMLLVLITGGLAALAMWLQLREILSLVDQSPPVQSISFQNRNVVAPSPLSPPATYHNAKHGFALRFPPDWSLIEYRVAPPWVLGQYAEDFYGFLKPGSEPDVEFRGQITLTVFRNPDRLPIRQFLLQNGLSLEPCAGPLRHPIGTSRHFTDTLQCGPEGRTAASAYLSHRDRLYEFLLFEPDSTTVFSQLLDSFLPSFLE